MLNFRSGILSLALTSALALAAASANAADMYRAEGGLKDGPVYVPAQTWTGFYIGANGGYAWNAGSSDLNVTGVDDDRERLQVAKGSANLDSSGGFGGGQIGYNWQRAGYVFGVEADIQGAGIDGKASKTVFTVGDDEPLTPFAASAKSSLDWFGTVRGRLGFTYDRALIYATGGFAYGGVKDRVSLAITDDVVNSGSLRKNETATGFVVGGGIEYALSPAWSLKGEYQYIDLGSDKLALGVAGDPAGAATLNVDHTYHTVRAGLNYHLHQDFEPLK